MTIGSAPQQYHVCRTCRRRRAYPQDYSFTPPIDCIVCEQAVEIKRLKRERWHWYWIGFSVAAIIALIASMP